MFTLLYTCPNMVRAVWSCQGAARHLLLARGAGTHCSARPDDCIPHQSFYYRQPVRQSMCCVFVGRWVGVKFESDSPKCRNSEFGQVSACICFAAAHCWLCRAVLVLPSLGRLSFLMQPQKCHGPSPLAAQPSNAPKK